MATTAANEDELNPLTGNTDDKKQPNMVEIELEKGRDPQISSEQKQEEAIPDKKDWSSEVGMACNKGYNWFPLGVFAWISGFVLIACAIGDMVALSVGFVEFWLYIYLIIGALFILIIDMPVAISINIKFVMKFQLMIFDWIKLFRRIWGRCVLYIILMVTCSSFLANDNDPSDFRSVPWIAGLYLLLIIVLSLIFSSVAAKKYNAIREYIIKSTVINNSASDESVDGLKSAGMIDESDAVDEEIELKKFISKFNELDSDKKGSLDRKKLSKLGEECGNQFSNAEKHAIMLLLDKECTGFITRPEWILQLRKHKCLRML